MDRRIGLGAALIFVVVMGWLYRGATATPTAPAMAPPPTPAVSVQAPITTPRPRPSRTPRPFNPGPATVEPATPEEDPNITVVTGRVTDEMGRAPARGTKVLYRSKGRRKRATSDPEGAFRFEVKGDSIEVWAERKDGRLTARSEKVIVDGSQGGEWEVDLVLDSGEQAGLGISVRQHDDGAFVSRVIDGSPAQELELVKGDVIIAVDGEDVAGKNISTISGMLGGPVGTTQLFTVRHLDGSIEELQFERGPIRRAEK